MFMGVPGDAQTILKTKIGFKIIILAYFIDFDSSVSSKWSRIISNKILLNVDLLDRIWKGGPDPAFPPFFHENPASRTFFIAIPNPIFSFPKIIKKD